LRIAFHSRSEPGATFDIFTVDLTGGDRRQITSSSGNDTSPAWAPRSRIAFVSDRDGEDHIYVVNMTTLDAVRATSGAGREIDPTWCRTLCFASNRDGTWKIYGQTERGGQAAQIVGGGNYNDTSPAYP
jgi:TolB protein